MTPDAPTDIRAMHAAYCEGSGMQLPLDPAREIQWYEVWRRGVRAEDIRQLIRFMRWKAKQNQPVRSLKFRTFVGNADYLEEDVVEMRAQQRARAPQQVESTDRASVLRSSGRAAAPEPPAGRPAAAVLDEALSADFDKLKRQIMEGTL